MVVLSIEDGRLCVQLKGLDKLWAARSRLEIALEHVVAARIDLAAAGEWWHGVRAPGTHLPGIIKAGTFYQRDERVFWDVHHPKRAVVIELDHERFDRLIVEVADPAAAVHDIEAALGHGETRAG